MSFELFVIFFASTFVISATPGPNMLLAFQHGLNYGVARTLWTLAGLSIGLFMLLVTALLGLDIINRQLPELLTAIKVAGALYLAYLGWAAWKHAKQTTHFNTKIDQQSPQAQPAQLFRTGVWVSLSNPKAILFFAAFFPKFIDFTQPLMLQYVLLTVGFFISETTWQLAYTFGGKKLAHWLQTGERLAWLNRSCGLLFVGIALTLLYEVWL